LGHVTRVPCHHGTACPQFADGGEGPQIWRVAANMLNSWTDHSRSWNVTFWERQTYSFYME